MIGIIGFLDIINTSFCFFGTDFTDCTVFLLLALESGHSDSKDA